MHLFLRGFIAFIFFVACRQERPEGIIPQEAMVPLLADFHLAEGYLSTLPLDSSRLMANSFYASVFERHQTDSAQLQQSLIYYSERPQVLNSIYDNVQAELQAGQGREQEIMDVRMRKVYVADSTKNAAKNDSIYFRRQDSLKASEVKHMVFWKHPDSAQLKPKAWSRSAHEHWMNRFFYFVKTGDESSEDIQVDSLNVTQ